MATFPSDCYLCNNGQRPDVGKCDQSLPPQEEFSPLPPAPPRGIIIRYQYQENITQVVLRGNSRVRRHGVSFPCGHSPSPELRTCPLTTPDCHRAAAVRRPLQVESRLAIVTLHIRAVNGTFTVWNSVDVDVKSLRTSSPISCPFVKLNAHFGIVSE